MGSTSMDKQTEIEAAVFRRLLQHLDDNKQVQNIELMNLAGFCRNCLSKWMVTAAQERGVELDYDAAREQVYGMPYNEWKAKYQTEATPEQLATFNNSSSN
nr:DUF1244 domain-containing protein [Ketobacter sp.]